MPRLSRKISPSNDYHQQPAQRPPVESKFPSTEEIARPFRGIHEELRPPRRSGEGSRGWRTGIWGRFFVFVAPFFGNGFVHHSFVASKSLKIFFLQKIIFSTAFFTKNHIWKKKWENFSRSTEHATVDAHPWWNKNTHPNGAPWKDTNQKGYFSLNYSMSADHSKWKQSCQSK